MLTCLEYMLNTEHKYHLSYGNIQHMCTPPMGVNVGESHLRTANPLKIRLYDKNGKMK